MFTHGRGAMFDWLARSGRDMSDCGLGSPVQHLERHGVLGENLLAIHVNYLAPGDAAIAGRNARSTSSIARAATLIFSTTISRCEELAAAGVNICLGTDSLASVYQTAQANRGTEPVR